MGLILVDIPFFLLSCPVVITGWRCSRLLRRLIRVTSFQTLGCARSLEEEVKEDEEEGEDLREMSVDDVVRLDAAFSCNVASWLHARDLANAMRVDKRFASLFGRKDIWKNVFKNKFPDEANAWFNDRKVRKCDHCADGNSWRSWFGDLARQDKKNAKIYDWLFAGCRGVVAEEFAGWICDIPYVCCALVVLLSPSRAIPLVRDLYRARTPSIVRAVCLVSIPMAILDILQVFKIVLMCNVLVQ